MSHAMSLIEDQRRYGDPLPAGELRRIRSSPAAQQPAWEGHASFGPAVEELAGTPGLADDREVARFGLLVAEAAAGNLNILQAGDCAEDPRECTPGAVGRKAGLLDALAGVLSDRTGKPVVRVGRIGGQFAKPRSRAVERHGDLELPVFRGHLVNGPEPDPGSRAHDPGRLVECHRAARSVFEALAGRSVCDLSATWTSHEALVLDYELPLLRRGASGRTVLSSTHWPWIGDRTRQPSGAHVRLLAAVDNPVACKVGPSMTPDELCELCGLLDPDRRPGRLTLIARQGADAVERNLPALVAAVRRAGHPVVWMCDPMHGNTVTTPAGRKTRVLEDVVREVVGFRQAVWEASGTAGGLHLETTPDDVLECLPADADPSVLGERYTSLCDPRLNPEQALGVVRAWQE
ncbi:3-deoxy-7-phosphoheptulonate synthase [Kitasatospora sp. NPDC056138]|uniref:3-deoxy-7-phosphoheptulonate synthase n=1 Tax=Kitasatospora sp. NPDC056138 TaxID=3345724 RepID=UPI0035DE5595